MGKSKSSGLARLPRDQKSRFLIGPVCSWFMPNITSIWTPPKQARDNKVAGESLNELFEDHSSIQLVNCDAESAKARQTEDDVITSYLCYGSIGCFCYGEVYHRNQTCDQPICASVNQLIDIKDDNSRVSCVRFLKNSPYPIVMILTENGTLLLHDCILNENLVQYKKNELLTKHIALVGDSESTRNEHNSKRAKFNITQQINSCTWLDAKNAFLAVSLLKEKSYFLLWLQFKDCTEIRKCLNSTTKNDWIEDHHKIDLDLPQQSSLICSIEAQNTDEQHCVVAIAMDDGLIIVIHLDLTDGKVKRNIKLVRHSDQICSLSLMSTREKKFPLGLLASVSRDGLVLIWDIENEFYFADYQTLVDDSRKSTKINWFALSFITLPGSKHTYLAVSNQDSDLTLLELPENARSKLRLKDIRQKINKNTQTPEQQPPKHNALIFNVAYDNETQSLVTSSLDGTFIFWKTEPLQIKTNKGVGTSLELLPKFLYPAMLNNSRSHMVRFSPIREDLLCLALGKASVKFYKISDRLNDCRFDMNTGCAMINRRIAKLNLTVTSIAWSPNHEYRLAIGTLEGKVFRADITPRKASLIEATHADVPKSRIDRPDEKLSLDSVTDDILGVEMRPLERTTDKVPTKSNDDKHQRTDGLYSLVWGPNPASPHDISKYAIYAVGSVSHRLFIYYSCKDNSDKISNYLDEFLDQSLPEAIGEAAEVSWKSSMDLMALGTTHGSIIIVSYLEESHADRSRNKLFKRLAVVQGPLGNSSIQCLAWHSTSDKTDPRYFHLAASSKQSCAFVFNLKETILVADVKARLKLENNSGNVDHVQDCTGEISNVLPAYVHKLDAHQSAITDIVWNPHDPRQLATASFDRSCFVWSVENSMDAQIIAKFSARDRLFTLEWSLVDPDLIVTSGHDSTIWLWRPSQNLTKL